jgi:hypothetical protein
MKKPALTFLIVLSAFLISAQNNNNFISINARYPVPTGDNFINKGLGNGYTGIMDIGLDYRMVKFKGFGMGISFNTSILRLPETDLTLVILSPKVLFDYETGLNRISIIPQIGVGYSNWIFRSPAISFTDESGNPVHGDAVKQNENGFNLGGGLKFVLNTDNHVKWYINFTYEYTRLEIPDETAENSGHNRNIQMFYPGVGLIWIFGR